MLASQHAARRSRRRRRREAPQGAQGRQGHRDPARRLPGPVLGPRPRADQRRTCSGRDGCRPTTSPGRTPASPPARADRPHADARSRARRAPGTTHRPDGRAVVTGLAGRRPAAAGSRSSRPTPRPARPGRSSTTRSPTPTPPRFSPDGSRVASASASAGRPTRAAGRHAAAGRPGRRRTRDAHAGFDRWPSAPRWLPDGSASVFARRRRRAADRSSGSTVGDGEVTRLTGDDGAYTDVQVSPTAACPLRPAVAVRRPAAPGAPRPRLPPTQEPARAAEPRRAPDRCPARCTEVEATAQDGAPRAPWLVLPQGAPEQSPAPLLLWIHGGPLMSWNAWSWRWSPWILAARGYAVLLPDPALSTGLRPASSSGGAGAMGRGALHRPHGDRPMRRSARPGHRRDPHRGDGRLVRRLHGELDRRPHRPLPGDRDPRQPVGRSTSSARTTDAGLLLGAGDGRPAREPSATSRTRRTATPTRSARRCW